MLASGRLRLVGHHIHRRRTADVYCAQNLLSATSYDQARTTREGIYSRGSFNVSNDMQLYIDMSYFQYEYFNQSSSRRKSRTARPSTPTRSCCRRVSPARPARAPAPSIPTIPSRNAPGCAEGTSCVDAAINYAFGDIPSLRTHRSATPSVRPWASNGDWDGWTYQRRLYHRPFLAELPLCRLPQLQRS